MENEGMIDSGSSYERSRLVVSPQASSYLFETGKWGKFLAIAGFCFVGLAVAGGLWASVIFSSKSWGQAFPFPGFLIGIIYVGVGLLYFFPFYYLFKFTRHLKKALTGNSSRDLEVAFANLRSHYKYIGILLIIVLGLYILFGTGMVMRGAFMPM